MTVNVYTGVKVSKAKGRTTVVALIDNTPEGEVVARAHYPRAMSPTDAAVHAIWLGVGVALVKMPDCDLRVYSPSKGAARFTRGGKPEAARPDVERTSALLAGWVIYWTREHTRSWAIEHRASKDMPEVVEALKEAEKAAAEALTPEAVAA